MDRVEVLENDSLYFVQKVRWEEDELKKWEIKHLFQHVRRSVIFRKELDYQAQPCLLCYQVQVTTMHWKTMWFLVISFIIIPGEFYSKKGWQWHKAKKLECTMRIELLNNFEFHGIVRKAVIQLTTSLMLMNNLIFLYRT